MKENFVQKLKKGKGKYKGKLSFKCFNCGGVGHFTGKYPFNEKNKNDKGMHRERGENLILTHLLTQDLHGVRMDKCHA